MSISSLILPPGLLNSDNKGAVISYLASLSVNAIIYRQAKKALLEWALLHDIEITGEDVQQLNVYR